MARQDDRGTVSWYGTDRQGTVRQIFDNSGGETHSAEYDAFGLVLRGTLLDRYGFHGREHDSLTGLRHHRAREFNGQFWMTEDPIGFAAGDANLRRFVDNGPGNATDPSGMDYIVIEGTTVYYWRTYSWLVPGRDVKIMIGTLVEIDGIAYVSYGPYLVHYDKVKDAIETFWSSGEGGKWKDCNKAIEWFRKNDVRDQVTKPHDERKAADRMFGPMAIVGGMAAITVTALLQQIAEGVLWESFSSWGAGRILELVHFAASKGLKVIRDPKTLKITHLEKDGVPLTKRQYEELSDEFTKANRVKGRFDALHGRYDDAIIAARKNSGDLGANTKKCTILKQVH